MSHRGFFCARSWCGGGQCLRYDRASIDGELSPTRRSRGARAPGLVLGHKRLMVYMMVYFLFLPIDFVIFVHCNFRPKCIRPFANSGNPGIFLNGNVFCLWKKTYRNSLPQMLRVWYIYLQNLVIYHPQ